MRITGARVHSARLGRIAGPETVREVGKALFAGGQLIQVEAQHSITEGAVSGAGHVASLPGEPPNADTHQLDREIETVQVAPLRTEVSAESPHAGPLEVGTAHIKPRPFMRPAAARKRRAAVDLVRAAVNRVNRTTSQDRSKR